MVIEWAKSRDGDIINIVNASKSLSPFKCFTCGEQLIAKNNDFIGRIKVFHYSHACNGGGCGSGESEHHYNVKCFFYHLLKTKLTNNEPHVAYTMTRSFLPKYSFNILDSIDKISIETKTAGDFLPDVSLLSNGNLLRAIEIVYKHEDSQIKTDFYIHNKIEVCKIYINDDTYSKIKDGNIPRIRYFDEPNRVTRTETEHMFSVLNRYFNSRDDLAKKPIENDKVTYPIKTSEKYQHHKMNVDRWVADKKKISSMSDKQVIIQKETQKAYLVRFDVNASIECWIPKTKCEIQKIIA